MFYRSTKIILWQALRKHHQIQTRGKGKSLRIRGYVWPVRGRGGEPVTSCARLRQLRFWGSSNMHSLLHSPFSSTPPNASTSPFSRQVRVCKHLAGSSSPFGPGARSRTGMSCVSDRILIQHNNQKHVISWSSQEKPAIPLPINPHHPFLYSPIPVPCLPISRSLKRNSMVIT
jgi:hypothetical protein